ncbi:MAG TPA: 2OG-Fe(II) oxygenase [Roseiarcus sp.]|nr:2OG-Fe(II) oxygenase [Roseiarcus sp.]
MIDAASVASSVIGCLDVSRSRAEPFRHWLLEDILPADVCLGIDAIPVAPPKIDDTLGKRETHNSTRLFFGAENRARHPVCEALAAGFQSLDVVERIELLCQTKLRESHLRIEYCLDTDGFWLEPHTDIGAKLFTMLVYLSSEPGSEAWGTDILDTSLNVVATAPYKRNAGVIFIPGSDTWHGFRRRPIDGVRRSLIINYVKPEWRSRHELAFPDRLAGA